MSRACQLSCVAVSEPASAANLKGMAIRPVRLFGDPILRTVADPVTDFDKQLRNLVKDLTQTLDDAQGAGLAAPQIGVGLRVFAYAVGSERGYLVNPELSFPDDEEQDGEEGCLSFPGIYVPVKRGLRARIRALDVDGQPFELEGAELLARALQHETDHLNGRLLIDQVGPVKREIIKRKLRKDAEAEAAEAAEAEEDAASAG